MAEHELVELFSGGALAMKPDAAVPQLPIVAIRRREKKAMNGNATTRRTMSETAFRGTLEK
jgi:hypothetical protein